MSSGVFDHLANRYDAWFETPQGSVVSAAEVACIRRVLPTQLERATEVGVGSGRFASELEIPEGVDPSRPMLAKAAARGIRTLEGRAESLPYEANSVAGILLVVTLCFLDDPDRAMVEFARVLDTNGWLLVGIVPADSSWGKLYRQKAEQGNPFYSVARFYTCRETMSLAASAGFELVKAASTLPANPGEVMGDVPVLDGVVPGCGFCAMLFRLAQKPQQ